MAYSWFKKLLIYLVVLILAFILSEICVRVFLDFPVLGFGKSYHIYPNDKTRHAPVYENAVFPHAKYYSTEAGYHVYRKNNLGLQGLDVTLKPGNQYIYVMGNSFVEARASKPEDIGTSVFMQKLQDVLSDKYQVINIGLGAQIPYYDWCRLSYWSRRIKPDYVVLILTDVTITNMMNNQKFDYVLPDHFSAEVSDWKFNVVKQICNHSAFANLVRVSFRKTGITAPANKREKIFFRPYDDYLFTPESYEALMSTLKEYHKRYGDRFMCFSLMNNTCNKITSADCKKLGINFAYDGDLKNMNDYIIAGGAHFNEAGNMVLGNDLFHAFQGFYHQ